MLYVILVHKDGKSWLQNHYCGGTAVLFSAAEAQELLDRIRLPGIDYEIICIQASRV